MITNFKSAIFILELFSNHLLHQDDGGNYEDERQEETDKLYNSDSYAYHSVQYPIIGICDRKHGGGTPVAENNYQLQVYKEFPSEEGSDGESDWDYADITTDGISIDDLYGMMIRWEEEPCDEYYIGYADPTVEEEYQAIPTGTITIESSNPDVALISYDGEKSGSVEIPTEYTSGEYFNIYYIGEGTSTITVKNEETVIDEETWEPTGEVVTKNIGEFDIKVSMGNLPELAFKDYDNGGTLDSWTINWHDVYREDSEAIKYVAVEDVNRPDQYLDGDFKWESSNEKVTIDSYGSEADIIVPRSVGITEEPITVTVTYTDVLDKEHTASMEINAVDFGVRETSYYDEEEYEYWNTIEDEAYTDTDSSMYLGAFKSDDTKIEDVDWSSDKEEVVKIGRKGRVYPMGIGTANITAEISLGDDVTVSKIFEITVFDPDTVKKVKYILNKGDNTAAVYSAKEGWDGTIPSTITVKGTAYTVTTIMDRFDFWSDNPINVTIPATMTDVGEAFQWLYGVKNIYVADGNDVYASKNGVLYDKDITKVIAYPVDKTSKSYTIPEGVVTIADRAITNDYLEKIYVPKSLKITDPFGENTTGYSAFEGNSAKYYIHPENKELLAIFEGMNWLDYEMDLGAITNFKASSTGTSSIKLSWTQANKTGVEGYYVYQLKNGSYEQIKKLVGTSTTSHTVTGLSAGIGYKFRVKAYGTFETLEGKTKTAYSTAATAILSTPTKPTKAALSKLTTGSKYVKAYWYKRTGTGYQVYVATNYKFTKGLKKYTIKSPSTLNKKVTKLKKGTTYYVKVRAYKTYNGKTVYGEWSSYKKIKCK